MSREKKNYMGLWTAVGVGLGAMLSATMDNNAVAWALGIGLGVAFGALMTWRASR